MKRLTYALLILFAIGFSACEFNESVKVDMTTGLTSKGSGLSCDDVFLTVHDEKINRNAFIFGEEFLINFNNIEGFKQVGGGVLPGISLLVVDKQGDTVLYNPDLYKDLTDPIKIDPLMLTTTIIIGTPFRSNRPYTASIHIWDKKGKGTFDTKFEFSTTANKSIKTSSAGITANEVYLYDESDDTVITSNKIPAGNEIMVAFDNLKGLNIKNDVCEPGMSMVITDKNGTPILNEPDLLKDQTIEASMQNKQVFAGFTLPKGVKSPVNVEVIVWDKIGNGKITTKAKLELE